MGQETVAGFQETEKPNLGSCEFEDGCCSQTVISVPEEFPNSNFCSRSAEETAVVLNDSENRSDDPFSGEGITVSEQKEEEKSCVAVDVKCGREREMWEEGERVCRICHLSSEKSFKDSSFGAEMELICLGCACNGELSTAHLHCAEAWFKVKGNRKCEICRETVNNVRGVGSEKFMEEWMENRARSNDNGNGNAPDSSHRNREEVCWHEQPFCNLLMVCFVVAFVLPRFFRINGGVL